MPVVACVSGRDEAVCARAVLDNDLLPERIGEFWRNDARRNVGKAARGKAGKDPHGFYGVSSLRLGCLTAACAKATAATPAMIPRG